MNISKLQSICENITPQQAYLAMFIFLDYHNKHCSNEMMVGEILGSGSILVDGGTADPAFWGEWLDAIEKARDERNWDIAKFELIS